MAVCVSIIIPTYNEHANIERLVREIDCAMGRESYEVIFVDDDSPDGTAYIIEKCSRDYPVWVFVRRGRRGLATAVVQGFAHSSGDIIVVMDADLQHPPSAIPMLLERVRAGSDVAVASRYVKGGSAPGLGSLRNLFSRAAVAVARALLPSAASVADPMSGFFALRRKVLDGIVLEPSGFKILLEILALGKIESVCELPFSFTNRHAGVSKMSLGEQGRYFAHLLSLMFRTGELARLARFCLVGLSGVCVNMGVLWFLTGVIGLFYMLSACISIEASIVTNFLANNAFTFRDRNDQSKRSLFARLIRFNAVSIVAVGVNLGVLWLLTSVAGLSYLLSNLAGIALATVWNFLVNNHWTWAARPRSAARQTKERPCRHRVP